MRFIKGDITEICRGVLINGVNCQNTMGSGVAKAYYTKWPIVKQRYHECKMFLGQCVPVAVAEDLIVANCWTQEYYGYDGKQYASVIAIYSSVSKAARLAKQFRLPLYTPLVGGGLGGLNRKTVLRALIDVEDETRVEITLVELP